MAPVPKWMATIDQFTAGKAGGLGVVLSAANPKNLALTIAAMAGVAQAGSVPVRMSWRSRCSW